MVSIYDKSTYFYFMIYFMEVDNPCIIKHNDRATEGYINRKI